MARPPGIPRWRRARGPGAAPGRPPPRRPRCPWDPWRAPGSWHGVPPLLFGNCGVGFAPVRARDRQALIDLMEGVEEIPGIAFHEGLARGRGGPPRRPA